MTFQLTEEQRRVLGATDLPVRVLDDQTNTAYVIVRADLYERVKALFEEDPLTREEQLYFLREAGKRAGWDDPEMDVYDDLDPRKRP